MAIYHLSTKPISRSSGRSAVASVAYRAGIQITDERLGKTYDYSKRSGVLGEKLLLPNHWQIDRAKLWNLAEKSENRKDARTAREIVINIPHELTDNNHKLAMQALGEFTRHLTKTYGVAVDVAYHAPDKQGDNRNYHAHLLLTTRKVTINDNGQITLGDKSQLELSNSKLAQLNLPKAQDELKTLRKTWADIANHHLEQAGTIERIDHRSHKDRGLKTLPTVKMGWQATELERKGIRTDVGDKNRAIKAYNEQILLCQDLQKQVNQERLEKHIQERLKRQKQIKKSKSAENALKSPTTPIKKSSATLVPPTPTKSHQSENRAVLERFKMPPAEYSQKLEFLEQFDQRKQTLAKQIHKTELKALQDKAKPLFDEIAKHRKQEPLFFGKDKWQQELDKKLTAYEAIKQDHDHKRDLGVTQKHIDQATNQLKQSDPKAVATAREYLADVVRHEHVTKLEHAQSLGADTYAKANQTYHGKIIQVTSEGALQQTANGVVYHRLTNLQVGKGYSLSHDDKTYQVRPDLEYLTKSQGKGKGR